MRILYLHQHFTTPAGAGGTRSYELARRLVAHGHQVTMICGSYLHCDTGLAGGFRRGLRKGTVDGIDVIEFDLPYSNQQTLAARAWTFVRFALQSTGVAVFSRYDLMFATSTPLTAGIPGILARWLRGKPFVFEVRDLWPELPREMGVITNPVVLGAMDWLEWSCYHSASACIGLSPGIVAGIERRGIPSDRIVMIPNGCDLDIFSPTGPKVRSDGIAPGDLVAAFTGAHGRANGLDAVLDAASELCRRQRNDVKLLFIGDGARKPSLVARAQSEGLANCLFLDPVPKRELAEIMAGVDVGLMILANVPAFYYGTSPNKFFDYVAGGLPVLNNYPGWLAEMVTANHCGLAVPPEDPQAFADALEYMADHREKLATMAVNAKALAQREFSRQQLADRFVEWIEAAAKRGPL